MTRPKRKSRRVPVRLQISERVKRMADAHADSEGKDFSQLVEEVLREQINIKPAVSWRLR